MPRVPYKPNREDDHSSHHADIHERLFEGLGLLRAGAGILIEWDGSQYKITSTAKGGGGGGFDWMYSTHKELDPQFSYSIGKWAYVSKLNPLVTAGMTDIISNATVVSCQGYWVCVQDVPAAKDGKFNVPVFPYPAGAATLGGDTFLQGTTAPSGTPLIGDLDLVDPANGKPVLYWVYLGDF